MILAQQGAELVGEPLPVPGGVLLGAGKDRDGPGEIGVVGQRPVGVHVGAEDVGQDQGVAGVGLPAGDGVAVAVSGGGHRVDREHWPAARPQHGDE
ncbi:hypothetical protein GCM10023237_69010 [Streptomyces coeruleoprunus]